MTVQEICRLLEAKILCCEHSASREVRSACGSDLMSDVLAFVKDHTVLLTGLTTGQAIRTAEMLDVTCIVFVRGKIPSEDILNMAVERDIPIMSTCYTMYEACGILYSNGLAGVPREQ